MLAGAGAGNTRRTTEPILCRVGILMEDALPVNVQMGACSTKSIACYLPFPELALTECTFILSTTRVKILGLGSVPPVQMGDA